jgi:hypothetical protein
MEPKMTWFKFFGQDWLTDLKIITLEPIDRLVYVDLLCMASISETPGLIKSCKEDALLKMFHLHHVAEAHGCLTRLEDVGMVKVTKRNETGLLDIDIINFRKRQDRALTNAERQALHRERQEDSNEEVTEGNGKVTHVTKRNETVTLEKRREEKNREEKSNTELPDWMNKEAWGEWEQHRKEIKEKQTPLAVKKQIVFLEKNKADHVEIINNSIQNGWKGLFELKGRKVQEQKTYQPKQKSWQR